MQIRNQTSIYLLFIGILLGIGLIGCGSSNQSNELTGDDFGAPAEVEDHDHVDHDHDDHGHEEEADTPVFDTSLTETDDEGVFIDHHGNRVVDELYQKFKQDGTQIEFTVENFLGVGGRGGEVTADIRAGERAVIKFRISNADNGEVLNGLRPLAWIDLQANGHVEGEHVEGEHEEQEALCRDKTEGFLSGMLTARPTIDLNGFFILAMNDDASISVIDPTVDISGMTQLFALIQLAGPGQDWALSDDQESLWVTIPSTNQIAVAELDGFSLAKHIDGGPNPMRIVSQPDGHFFWVGNDVEQGTDSGVTVLDAQSRQAVARIPTGAGHHEIAFSKNGRFAFISNSLDGSLSVIDTTSLEKIKDIDVGQSPVTIAVSSWNGSVYVADAASGAISVLDGQDFDKIADIETEPGMTALAFSPDGRWAFVANPVAGSIHIIDVETNRVTHSARVDGAPDKISFGEQAVYFRSLNANGVYVVSLDELDPDGNLELATVPIGEQAPGQYPSPSLAGAVSSAGRQGAMVIANPADDQVYFFPEGATAPSGSFQGHTLRPRAVTIIDRSLREEIPGVYTGRARIPESGKYMVAFMLGDPLVVHCFEFNASPGENNESADATILELTIVSGLDGVRVNEPAKLQFRLTDADNGAGVSGLTDVTITASQTAGNWTARAVAIDLGDGLYEIAFTPPQPGLYTIFFAVPSLRVSVNHLPFINMQATLE